MLHGLLRATSRAVSPDRVQAYVPLLIGMFLVAYGASVAMGPGLLDASGTPVGADWLAFYTGGHFVLSGLASELWDLGAQEAFQQGLFGDGFSGLNDDVARRDLPLSVLRDRTCTSRGLVNALGAWGLPPVGLPLATGLLLVWCGWLVRPVSAGSGARPS